MLLGTILVTYTCSYCLLHAKVNDVGILEEITMFTKNINQVGSTNIDHFVLWTLKVNG